MNRFTGMSMETYYDWRKKYGWMSLKGPERVRELESENTKPKRPTSPWKTLLTDEHTNKLEDLMGSPQQQTDG